MNFVLFMPYCVGTMCGSLCGVKISMYIEKLLGAEADGHLKKPYKAEDQNPTTADLIAYWVYRDDPNDGRSPWEAPTPFADWVKEQK